MYHVADMCTMCYREGSVLMCLLEGYMMHSALVVWGVGSHGVHGICLVFVGWVEMVYLWFSMHAHGENLVESGCVTEVHVTVVRLQPSVWFVFQVLVVCRLCVPGMSRCDGGVSSLWAHSRWSAAPWWLISKCSDALRQDLVLRQRDWVPG